MFEIGKIVNTQGIKGVVRVIPMTDDIKRFELLKSVFVCGKTEEVYEIESVGYHKQFVLLKFKGVDDMTEAELKLKNKLLKIDDSDALPLEEDEHYIRDIMGCVVETVEGEVLGEVKDILFTGANDVYVVDHNGKEILIPATKNCVQNIDTANKKITIVLLKGLI